jgi:hypothetical protein
VIGGLNLSINNRDKPLRLDRQNDFPSMLRWISQQPFVFYDVDTRRAWLVDGASALLHLLRMSLHRDGNDAASPYEWMFDASQLRDASSDLPARLAALNVLKSSENGKLRLYPTGSNIVDGQEVEEYATLRKRTLNILRSLEAMVDSKATSGLQEGIVIRQTLDLRRDITGFDVDDVLGLGGPIYSRMQLLGSHGHGWSDLISEANATTIFGRGFGELIRPCDASTVCSEWARLPVEEDYLATTVPTLKLLLERCPSRMEPSLSEFTERIVCLSSRDSLRPCICVRSRASTISHTKPLQLLSSKRRWNAFKVSRKFSRKGLAPMKVFDLDERGAVVFGHISFLGWGGEGDLTEAEGGQGQQMQMSSLAPPPGPPSSSQSASSGLGLQSLSASGLTGSGSLSASTPPSVGSSQPSGSTPTRRKRNWLSILRGKRTSAS